MKQKCNHRRKTLHIWSFYQGMFGKLFNKPQLPTDTWSRKGLENVNACLIITFSVVVLQNDNLQTTVSDQEITQSVNCMAWSHQVHMLWLSTSHADRSHC